MLRDAARTNPLLVLKGGALDGKVVRSGQRRRSHSPTCRAARCCSPSFAGALQAPLVKTAGLLQALPRNFAYGLKALIDQREAA